MISNERYKETNEREFDGMLSQEEYDTFVKLYSGISNGREERYIDRILMLPVEFNNVCEWSDFCYADEPTLVIIQEAQSILAKHNIELPGFDKIKSLTVDKKNGWEILWRVSGFQRLLEKNEIELIEKM